MIAYLLTWHLGGRDRRIPLSLSPVSSKFQASQCCTGKLCLKGNRKIKEEKGHVNIARKAKHFLSVLRETLWSSGLFLLS